MAALWFGEGKRQSLNKFKIKTFVEKILVCVCVCCCRLVRGPGVFGEVQVHWNITPAVFSEFELTSGTVTMRDRQSEATIVLKVPRF